MPNQRIRCPESLTPQWSVVCGCFPTGQLTGSQAVDPGGNECGFCAEKWERHRATCRGSLGTAVGCSRHLGGDGSAFERGWVGGRCVKSSGNLRPHLRRPSPCVNPSYLLCSSVPCSETGCLAILTSSPLGVNSGSLTSHVQDQYLNFPSQTHSSPKSMNQHHH